jgi:hypothetical protein
MFVLTFGKGVETKKEKERETEKKGNEKQTEKVSEM